MEQAEYKQLVASLEGLTGEQFDAILNTLQQRKDSDGVQRLIMARMAEKRCCPHCDGYKIVKHGTECGSQRFRCKNCLKTFTTLTGTPFHRLRDKTKFLDYASCMIDGLSIRKIATRMGMSIQKAFRWRHKFLSLLEQQKPSNMVGLVEADETVFPVSYKGQKKGMPRASKKRSGKTKDGSGAEKTRVVVAVQRGTRIVFDQVLSQGKTSALTDALRPALGSEAVLSTDGNASYWTVAKELGVKSGSFVSAYHGKGGNGVWHVQSVNRYDSSLKGWMARFRGVATKYLANYLGWRRLLDRFHEILTPQQLLFHALRTSYQ
jgi:transposase-like protein